MIHPHRELIRAGCDLGRGSERALAIRAGRIVGQRVGVEDRLNRVTDGDGEHVGIAGTRTVGKADVHFPVAFVGGGYREDLRCAEDLAESLVLAEEKGVVMAAAVDSGKHDRPADRPAKLVADECRNAAVVRADVVEVVACVERCIAEEFKHAAVNCVRAGPRDHVGVTGRAVPDLGQHDAGTGLHFLNGVDVEVGKSGAAHFRVGSVGAVHRKDGRRAPLAVDRKLLCKICRPVGVGHGAGRQKQQFAKVARVERQAGDFRAGKTLSAARLGCRNASFLNEDKPFLRTRQLQGGSESCSVFNLDGGRGLETGGERCHGDFIFRRGDVGEGEFTGGCGFGRVRRVAGSVRQRDRSAGDGASRRVAQHPAPRGGQRRSRSPFRQEDESNRPKQADRRTHEGEIIPMASDVPSFPVGSERPDQRDC